MWKYLTTFCTIHNSHKEFICQEYTDELLQVGILVAEPPVQTVSLITNYQSPFTTNYQERFFDPNWFVKWVLIKTASGDRFRCSVEAWIDQRSVMSKFISLSVF